MFALFACFATFFAFALFDLLFGSFDARFRHDCIFSSASSMFFDCVRCRYDCITKSPSLLIRFFSKIRNRLETHGWSQSLFASKFRRMSTFVLTLFTF